MTKQIGLRLTEDELDCLNAASATTGLPISIIARIALKQLIRDFQERGTITVLSNENKTKQRGRQPKTQGSTETIGS